MKLIIETKDIARCVETNKEFAITNLEKLKANNEIVEDKTKPAIKPKTRSFSETKKEDTNSEEE